MFSENAVTFYSAGGHSHDGRNSSLIATSAYSIYDFSSSFVGDNPERRRAQVNNFNSFKQLVINTINSAVLEPAGIILQDNIINSRNIISGSITAEEIASNTIAANNILAGTITGNEIAANTITSNNIQAGAITTNELAANLVLINNIISSNNYVEDESGWQIDASGLAEFNDVIVRGNIAINNTNYWLSNGIMRVGTVNTGIHWDGANFVTSGTVFADSGAIGGWVISNDNLTSGNYPGETIIGPGAGPNGTGAVYIRAPVVEGVSEAVVQHSGYGSVFNYSNTVSNTLISVLTVDAEGISYNYGTERFEFYYDSGNDQLYAVIDGYYYCISKCGSSGPPGPTPTPTPTSYAYSSFCYDGSCQQASAGFTDCASLEAFVAANFPGYTNFTCTVGSQPACPSCGSPTPTPTPVPTPVPTPTPEPTPTPPPCSPIICGSGFCDICNGCVCLDGGICIC